MSRRASPVRAKLLRAIADGHTTTRALQSACLMTQANVHAAMRYAQSKGYVVVAGKESVKQESWGMSRARQDANVWALTDRGREEIAG